MEMQAKWTRRAAGQVWEGEEASVSLELVLAEEGAGDERAHQTSLVAVFLGHDGRIVGASLVVDRHTHYIAVIAKVFVDVIFPQLGALDLELDNGRRVDDSAVPVSESARSSGARLLAQLEAELDVLRVVCSILSQKVDANGRYRGAAFSSGPREYLTHC